MSMLECDAKIFNLAYLQINSLNKQGHSGEESVNIIITHQQDFIFLRIRIKQLDAFGSQCHPRACVFKDKKCVSSA